MKYKSKLRLVIIGLVIVVLIGFFIFTSPTIRKEIQDNHNSKIDFFCVKDSDCSIKYIGCDMCYGKKRECTNLNSTEGWCLRIPGKIHCMGMSVPPKSCSCINNTCKGDYDY